MTPTFQTHQSYRLYLLVSDTVSMQRFLDIGVKTIQLRIKNKDLKDVEKEITKALTLMQQYGAQIVINDYADLALTYDAPFLHIGQEDLTSLSPQTYTRLFEDQNVKTQCGFSTHSYEEFEHIAHLPSCYIALGPIFETTTKDVGFPPCGVDLITTWKEKINQLDNPKSLVTIGGITLENAPQILQKGADMIAISGDIINHPKPFERARDWLDLLHQI